MVMGGVEGMRREISRTKKMSEEETFLGRQTNFAADYRPDAQV